MIPRFTLAPGYTISRLIKGHWQITPDHRTSGSVSEAQALRDMAAFADAGITTFDVADIYTGAEDMIGRFLRQYGRGKIQVHTKYVPNRNKLQALTRQDTQEIIDRSLRRLNIECLDMVQFHWWDMDVPGYIEAALYLQDLRRAGKIHHLGVTNFDTAALRSLIEAGVGIATAQVQYSLLDRRPENGLITLARAHDINLLCYGTLAGGFLSEKWLGRPDPGAGNNRSLTKYGLIIDECGGWNAFQALLQTLHDIAKRKKTGIAEIALAYVLNRDRVAAAIVGAHNARHLQSLKRAAGLSLDGTDRAELAAAQARLLPLSGDVYGLERHNPSHKDIMKYNLNTAR